MAGTLRILSAGAIEPGVHNAIAAYEKQSGAKVSVRFATAPVLTSQKDLAASYDVVLAPPPVLDRLREGGELADGSPVPVGRVGVGIVARDGTLVPSAGNAGELKALIAGAPTIVINQASTGKYIDRLLDQWDMQQAAPVIRYPDGNAVMHHLLSHEGGEIAFAAITEIRLYHGKGLTFAGPLPADVQNYTSYAASGVRGAVNTSEAAAFLALLGSGEGRAAFASAGIEAAA